MAPQRAGQGVWCLGGVWGRGSTLEAGHHPAPHRRPPRSPPHLCPCQPDCHRVSPTGTQRWPWGQQPTLAGGPAELWRRGALRGVGEQPPLPVRIAQQRPLVTHPRLRCRAEAGAAPGAPGPLKPRLPFLHTLLPSMLTSPQVNLKFRGVGGWSRSPHQLGDVGQATGPSEPVCLL